MEELAYRVAAAIDVVLSLDTSPWLTIDEAAEHTRLPKNTLYKLTAAGAVPHYKPGNRLLFRRDELDDWIEGFREGNQPNLANGNGRGV